MNQTIQDIISRRSCRKFTDQMPSQDDLNLICEAGSYAASGHNTQCPIILAVTNKELIDRMSKLNAQVWNVDFDPFYGAPVVLVVLADRSISHTPVEDGSLVIGNMLLAAHSLGLGACWINRAREVFEMPEGKQILAQLGIEGDYIGVGNCIVGCPVYPPRPPKPRKEDYIRWIK